MTTKTTKAMRSVSAGKNYTYFNDVLQDGRRSLKVWGWSREQYDQCTTVLRAQGCGAEVVTRNYTHPYNKKPITVTRLWVRE